MGQYQGPGLARGVGGRPHLVHWSHQELCTQWSHAGCEWLVWSSSQELVQSCMGKGSFLKAFRQLNKCPCVEGVCELRGGKGHSLKFAKSF